MASSGEGLHPGSGSGSQRRRTLSNHSQTSAAATSGNPPGSSYDGLAYAPRQRVRPPMISVESQQQQMARRGSANSSGFPASTPTLSPSPSASGASTPRSPFQSHSTLLASVSASNALNQSPIPNKDKSLPSPHSPVHSGVAAVPVLSSSETGGFTADQDRIMASGSMPNLATATASTIITPMATAASSGTARSKLALQEMKGRAQALGLPNDSFGWQMLEKLHHFSNGAGDSEWNRLLDLVSDGQCILLLPRQDLGSRYGHQVSLASVQDHILVHAGPSRPSPASFKASKTAISTLSGLRCEFESASSSDGEQEEEGGEATKTGLLRFKSFIPRPELSFVSELRNERTRSEFLRNLAPLPKGTRRFPVNETQQFQEHFSVPAAPPSQSLGGQRRPPPARPTPARARPTSTFASLFGGSARTRIRNKQQQQQDLREGVRDHVNLGPPSADSTYAAPASAPVQGSADGFDPDPEDLSAAASSQGSRTISVWIVENIVRKHDLLAILSSRMHARLREKLESQGVSAQVVEVVCSFAAMFLPPLQTTGRGSISGASGGPGGGGDGLSSGIKPSASNSSLLTPGAAPYLAGPDDLADGFQTFYSDLVHQLHAQLESDTNGAHTDADAIDSQVKAWVQVVESAICEEVYDRIFMPFSSRDWFLDLALSSRIAALNLLGLTLSHLGLVLDRPDHNEARKLHQGLEQTTKACGMALAKLNEPDNHAPERKLAVLMAAHRSVVDSLADLPPIRLSDEEPKPPPKDDEREQQPEVDGDTTVVVEGDEGKEKTRAEGAASADLLLPLLIYSIVRSNPQNLASHLLFIQRYRADCLLNGETSYCLVNMQAAVAFIENVEPSALGFEGVAALPASGASAESVNRRERSANAVEMLASPPLDQMSISDRVRNRLATDFGDLAGVSNKVITGVLGTSLTAFGRIIGSNTPTSERGPPQTVEDFRERLQGSANRRGARKITNEFDGGRRSRTQSFADEEDARSIRSTRSRKVPTDYASVDEVTRDNTFGVSPGESSKLSLSDRLAAIPMLSRFGIERTTSNNTTSQASPALAPRELPAPPPPAKLSLAVQEAKLPASLRSPYPSLEQPPTAIRPLHVVLAATGSVASIKIPLIVEELLAYEHVRVQVVPTKAALHFFDRDAVHALESVKGKERQVYSVKDLAAENIAAGRSQSDTLTNVPRVQVWKDQDEWEQWNKVGDAILHIELRRWADIVLVAPCSADTLAKIQGGICDNLLTSFLRALSPATPTILFPAMNTLMWLHPLTARQIAFVKEVIGYEVLGPIEKRLACGDLGQGAMLEWTEIVDLVVKRFGLVPAARDSVTSDEQLQPTTKDSAPALEQSQAAETATAPPEQTPDAPVADSLPEQLHS